MAAALRSDIFDARQLIFDRESRPVVVSVPSALWDFEMKTRILELKGLTNPQVVFSPQRRKVATFQGSVDPEILIWDVGSGSHRALRGHTEGIYDIVFGPDSNSLSSTSGDGTIRLWNLKKNDFRVLHPPDPAYSVAFSPDGRWLAGGCSSGALAVWRTSDGTLVRVLHGHPQVIWTIAFSPDGGCIAAGGPGGLSRWQTSGSWPGHSAAVVRDIRHIAFLSNAQLRALGDGRLWTWDSQGAKLSYSWNAGAPGELDPGLSPDGRRVSRRADEFSFILEDEHGREQGRWRNRLDAILCTALDPTRRKLAVGLPRAGIGVWGLDGESVRPSLGEFSPQLMAWSNTDTVLVYPARGGIAEFHPGTGAVKTAIPLEDWPGVISALQASPDGKSAATVTLQGDYLGLHGSVELHPGGHRETSEKDTVLSLAFTADGRMLACGSDGPRPLKLWQVPALQKPGPTFPPLPGPVEALTISRAANLLVVGCGDHSVGFFRSDTGKLVSREKGHTAAILCLDCSDDGRVVVSGSADNTARIWRIGSDRPFLHPADVQSVHLSSDSQTLVTLAADHLLRFWDTSSQKHLATALSADRGRSWAVWTPNGDYDGNAGGLELLNLLGPASPPGLLGRVLRR